MITILSPAKSISADTSRRPNRSDLIFPEEVSKIDAVLKKKSKNVLKKMHSVSDAIAEENYLRNQERDFADVNGALPAAFAFSGEVYRGLDAEKWTAEDLAYADDHLRIISGMYGILKPQDPMWPYRLEMGTKITVARKPNLYQFWGRKLSDYFNELSQPILNLASVEYSKAVNTKHLKIPVIQVDFKDEKNGNFKVVQFWAKQARGVMANWMIKNRVNSIEDCKNFAENDYYLAEAESSDKHLIFHRNER
jgi:cytoplasmic iron level regulating protein YaaA (DUF328/UPF0246 family)